MTYLVLLGLAGCATGGGRGHGPTDLQISPAGYCQVVAMDGLLDWTGTTATLCPGLVGEETEHDGLGGEGCVVHVVDGNGRLSATSITGARAAQALGDGRFVVWGWDGRLSLRDARGGSTEIAPVALDPWVDAASRRVAFVAPLNEGVSLDPGDDREVVLYDVTSGARASLIIDATAAAPVPIPGTSDVLYVSSASGVASIVRVSETETRTLTNVDATAVEQEFVPVYGRQLVFVDGGDRLVFAAEYESDVIWSVDLRTGDAEELGPGRFPALGNDGSVLASSTTGEDCASHYLDGRTP
jgi:hypothetical protein